MEKRRLGTTDLDVSVICLGTMTWGEQNTEADGHAQLDRALDAGINFVDTAEMYAVPPREETYGRTEEIIGSWLTKTSRRDDIILATKVAAPSPRFPYIRPELNGPKLNRANIIAACDASLKRLKTDYVDLYQVHWPERITNFFGELYYRPYDDSKATPLLETLEALGELVKAGKVRHIGLSNETPWGVMQALHLADKHTLPRVQSVQNPYNLLNRSYEVGMAEVSWREKCGLLAYSPLAFGVLSGKYLGGTKPEGARLTLFGDTMTRYLSEQATKATEAYVTLAKEHNLDPALMALAFVNQQHFLTSNIIGATTLEQLDVAIQSADTKLSKELMKALTAVDIQYRIPSP